MSGTRGAWAPTREAFERLLEWLGEGQDSGSERYLEVRRRLVNYFDRRNCAAPEDLADQTLDRVMRRLEEQGNITDAAPAQYCYIVARYIFLEHIREAHKEDGVRRAMAASDALVASDGAQEKLLDCLQCCLDKLPQQDREMIVEYYQGTQRQKIEHRKAVAHRLGLTANALAIRACRVRTKLEECVRACAQE